MHTKVIACGLMLLLMAIGVRGQEEEFETLDTNYYVAGVADWDGNLKVQVLSPMEFAQLKKDVDLDNKAMTYAYQNIKSDWKAKHTPATTATTATAPKAKIPPFPLKRPMPKVFRFFGKFPTTAEAETKKTFYEERETARQQRLEAEKERAQQFLSEEKQAAVADKASTAADLMEQLIAEIEDVKIDFSVGTDPGREKASSAKSGSGATRTVTFKQGPRLGEGPTGALTKDGALVKDGPLVK